MPKKTDATGAATGAITGFDTRETKILAAAFLSQVGPDKFDYDVFSKYMGNSKGHIQNTFPKIKRKAAALEPTLSKFLGLKEAGGIEESKPKKRKAEDDEDEIGDSPLPKQKTKKARKPVAKKNLSEEMVTEDVDNGNEDEV